MESRILRILVSLGVPGVALGIFYLLFRTFKWEFAQVPEGWVGPIVVLFMILVSGVVFYTLTLWRPVRPSTDGAEEIPTSDTDLIKRHRRIFDRPAFRMPCIYELSLRELRDAIDQTQAAINTGKLYSRDGNLQASFPDRSAYQTPQFKDVFGKLPNQLTQLKRLVTQFESAFAAANPGYSHHEDFYAMILSLLHSDTTTQIANLVNQMDKIDTHRNKILSEVNQLLKVADGDLLPVIELSSTIIKGNQIGGADQLAPHLR